jgi:hypothetical protein
VSAVTLDLAEHSSAEELRQIVDGVRSYNRGIVGPGPPRAAACFLRDDEGRIVGGAHGELWGRQYTSLQCGWPRINAEKVMGRRCWGRSRTTGRPTATRWHTWRQPAFRRGLLRKSWLSRLRRIGCYRRGLHTFLSTKRFASRERYRGLSLSPVVLISIFAVPQRLI